jgi:hypothetical protein
MRHVATIVVSAAACIAGAGCSSKSSGDAASGVVTLPTLPAYAAPANAIDIYTPIFTVPPGSDTTWCTFTDKIASAEMLVHTTEGVESPYGHHALLFYAPQPDRVGQTVLCDASDMAGFRQMLGGTGGEGQPFWKPPPNIASRVPKGAQFVLQSHWINTTSQPQQVQAHMAVVPQDPGVKSIVTGSVAVTTVQLAIPAHGAGKITTECSFDADHKLMILAPHEHEFGNLVQAEVHRAGTGAVEMLLDVPFKPVYMSHPPYNDYGVDAPLVIAQGDSVRLTCGWANTTDNDLLFPREMCVLFAFSLEDDDAHCTDGVWDHTTAEPASVGAGGGPPMGSCAQPGQPGNSHGVGTYCSPAGKQCKAFPQAPLCLADVGQDTWMCTRLGCKADSECGEAAHCHFDPGGSACVPDACGAAGAAGAAGGLVVIGLSLSPPRHDPRSHPAR